MIKECLKSAILGAGSSNPDIVHKRVSRSLNLLAVSGDLPSDVKRLSPRKSFVSSKYFFTDANNSSDKATFLSIKHLISLGF